MTPTNRRALARLALVQAAQRARRLRQLLVIDPEVQAARLRSADPGPHRKPIPRG
jgi:hypothetical protein